MSWNNCCSNFNNNCWQQSNWPNTYCQSGCAPNLCASVCQPACNPCLPICQNVTYIANTGTITLVPSGGGQIPSGSIILPGSTTVPAGTVTPITTFLNTDIFLGGITVNNGFFTIPIGGQYILSVDGCFTPAGTTSASDVRRLLIYKVNAITGLVTLIAEDSRTPATTVNTCINLTSIADLKANDRVFFAATQTTATGSVTILDLSPRSRVAITKISVANFAPLCR